MILVGALLIGLGAYFGIKALVHRSAHASTDDAFLEAHIVALAPKVAGIVSAVYFRDNEWVTNGQLLVEIDPRDFEAKAAQRHAALTAAKANAATYGASFELMKTRVETAEAVARQSKADADAAAATAERSKIDFERARQLREQNVASQQEYDQARTTFENATATLTSNREKAAADQSRVTEARAQLEAARNLLETASAQAAQSQADLTQAELDLSYAKIAAPSNGRVARKAVERGTYLQVGQRICALVPSNVWVVANFKETQLAKMRVGQAALIHIDAYDHDFRGHVESVQAGSGARFSLLPPENAVGNFVKVVQRVPVKIVFDEFIDVPNPVGPGMSVVPTVRVSAQQLSNVIILLLAIATALVVGGLWWWLAARKRS